jgi:hypothetical protein
MITFDISFPGRLLSDTDRKPADSVGPILTNPILQSRLKAILGIMAEFDTTYGSSASRTIRGIDYTAVFAADWELKLDVQLLLGIRQKGQRADIDNLWKPFQNALAFPNVALELPGIPVGSLLHTIAENDRQFSEIRVRLVPYPWAEGQEDMTLIHVTALPPPHLEISLQR